MEPYPSVSTQMTITIRLSPEEEKKLMERASETGQDVASYIQRLVARH